MDLFRTSQVNVPSSRTRGRAGFDVRTVQHWMGHKSLETTMRYLVPAADVHDRLDQIGVPGTATAAAPKRSVQSVTVVKDSKLETRP